MQKITNVLQQRNETIKNYYKEKFKKGLRSSVIIKELKEKYNLRERRLYEILN